MADIAACLSSEKMDWLTPPEVLDLVRRFKPICLDPCTTPENPVGAVNWCSEGGLTHRWCSAPKGGLVYVNPPYGREVKAWVAKCATEALMGVEVIALLPARPDSKWFQTFVLRQASAILWWRGRIKFVGAESSAPFPSALVYYGPDADRFERIASEKGVVTVL